MQMRRGIRANLPSDKEIPKSKSPRHDRVIDHTHPGYKKPFSIYRPLTEDSSKEVWNVLGKVRHDIAHLFAANRNSSAELVVPAELGVVFVPRHDVRQAMAEGLWRRFEAGRMLERLESHTQSKHVALPTPLHETDWFGDGAQEREIVYTFGDGDALEELNMQSAVIRRGLDDARAGMIEVYNPNHLKLFKYGRFGQELSNDQKAEASDVIEDHFRAAGVGEIALGSLVISQHKEESYING